jgi:hypothetical protein
MKIGVYPHSRIFHDRENRKENPYFSDEKTAFIRNKTVYYANPLNETDIQAEINQLKNLVLKSFIKFNFNRFFFYKNQFVMLSHIAPVIKETKEQSKKKGLNFLDTNAI